MRENGYVEIGMRRKQIADCEFQRPKKSSSYLTLPAYTLIRVLVFDIEFKPFLSEWRFFSFFFFFIQSPLFSDLKFFPPIL